MNEKKRLEGDYETSLNIIHSDERGTYVLDKPRQGVNPMISVYADNIPSAWELAMLSCWDYGTRVGTHYDTKKDTPKSKEGSICVKISNPFNEPRIHKNFPGGPEELESYRQEVVNGIHDNWIDPQAGKWTYTYHERLTNWNPYENEEELRKGGKRILKKGINQINEILCELNNDITSKAAQMITWYPTADPKTSKDRPCLQRLWFRPLEDNDGYLLNLNSHWRSRDLGKAWFMNVYAITDWQREIANQLQERIGKPVRVGSYTDISDSLHIYGDYFEDFKKEFERMRNPNLEKRVWNSNHPAFQMMTEEAKRKLKEDPDWYKKGRG